MSSLCSASLVVYTLVRHEVSALAAIIFLCAVCGQLHLVCVLVCTQRRQYFVAGGASRPCAPAVMVNSEAVPHGLTLRLSLTG